MLDKLKQKYPQKPANMALLFRYVAKLCGALKDLGVFNMLLTNGVYVLALCTTQPHWITRRAPFGQATLIDSDWKIDFRKETTVNDVVTAVAIQLLTDDENWQNLQSGESVVYKFGELISRRIIKSGQKAQV